jgi:hypothetical protein
MNTELQKLVAFRMTKEWSEAALSTIKGNDLRPVSFAGFEDLSALRYDYPLILAGDGKVVALSDCVDAALRSVAEKGLNGERLRANALRLEAAVRTLAIDGTEGKLCEIWNQACNGLLVSADAETAAHLEESAKTLKAAMNIDGDIIDCGHFTASRIAAHIWKATQKRHAKPFRDRLDDLILKLSNILKADYLKGDAARAPDALKGAMGDSFSVDFNFEALSSILERAAANDTLPPSRAARIQATLDVLQEQRFFAITDGCPGE